MRISNEVMLCVLADDDAAQNYPHCADLTMAGEDYKINRIACFAHGALDAAKEYVMVKRYDDSFVLMLVMTEDDLLIREAFEYVDEYESDAAEVELRTRYPSVLENDALCSRYTTDEASYPPNPVYFIRSEAELIPAESIEGVEVTHYTESDKDDIAEAVKRGLIDGDMMNAEMFVPISNFFDVKWYMLRVGGNIAGYLRAECGFRNIYDIGWLYVEPRYRGHGYARQLVTYFARDMFDNSKLPHYGYAVSDQSARTAEHCGFIRDDTLIYSRALIKIKP